MKLTREDLIAKLIERDYEDVIAEYSIFRDILEDGIGGYKDLSNEELMKEWNDNNDDEQVTIVSDNN